MYLSVCVGEFAGQYILSLHFNAELLHCRFSSHNTKRGKARQGKAHHTIISYRITMKIIMVKSCKREFDMKTLNQLNERHIASTQITHRDACQIIKCLRANEHKYVNEIWKINYYAKMLVDACARACERE